MKKLWICNKENKCQAIVSRLLYDYYKRCMHNNCQTWGHQSSRLEKKGSSKQSNKLFSCLWSASCPMNVLESPRWMGESIIKYIAHHTLEISHAQTKVGSPSSNLTFLGLNMATKRPCSKTWRYQTWVWGSPWLSCGPKFMLFNKHTKWPHWLQNKMTLG
jgi:hypothetical protein